MCFWVVAFWFACVSYLAIVCFLWLFGCFRFLCFWLICLLNSVGVCFAIGLFYCLAVIWWLLYRFADVVCCVWFDDLMWGSLIGCCFRLILCLIWTVVDLFCLIVILRSNDVGLIVDWIICVLRLIVYVSLFELLGFVMCWLLTGCLIVLPDWIFKFIVIGGCSLLVYCYRF